MIGNDWDKELEIIWKSEGFNKFMKIIQREYDNKIVYPAYDNIFEALKLTPYCNVKVVIVGQDPYHGENEAHGLSFSVLDGIKLPPSLKNIYKELEDDLQIKPCNSGNLTKWAQEGVLMLNTVLTVRAFFTCSNCSLKVYLVDFLLSFNSHAFSVNTSSPSILIFSSALVPTSIE